VFQPGSKLVHPFNPELGVGVVREVDGRFLTVYFPAAERELVLSAAARLDRLVLAPGDRARLLETGDEVVIGEAREHRYLLADGREVDDAALWPLERADSPIERLASLRLDSLFAFRNRVDGLELMQLREAGGLGSFLGGRIELFPHQLHAALHAVDSDPVRWLLADEVGLGKTVEACLILSALVRTGRAQRALVVAPSTLTVQWLGELYRKFHQVFVLLDRERIESVEIDYGEGVNPFEVHPYAVISLESLASDPTLLQQAGEAGLDLVVLDEAHRLVRPEFADALRPLVLAARHAILLTATPLQADRRGFYRLLSLLHPDRFASFEAFERAVDEGDAEISCTSAVRRVDVGGLPPRVPLPIDVGPPGDPAGDDERTDWLIEHARTWSGVGEKALIFVRDLATLEPLARRLESATQLRVTMFHEKLSVARRDIEVAAFRDSATPLLLCTEAGGEGRNFQFCDRMVHYDLPRDPVELEQRIGRLDRIGRQQPVEIVYFRHPRPSKSEGSPPDVARLYERLGLFETPAAGLDVALAGVWPALEAAAASGEPLDEDALVASVEGERSAGRRDLRRVFYRDAYTVDQAESLLARVPSDLEPRTRQFCVTAAQDLGFEVVEKGGAGLYYVEFGRGAKIDSLPGVVGGARYLGTFDREEAVEKEELEFFASGHPLVEGLLLELEDGTRGRAAMIEIPEGVLDRSGAAGLLCFYKHGPDVVGVVIEADGTRRPEWVAPLRNALPDARRVRSENWNIKEGWAEAIRALGDRLEAPGTLVAAAFFRSE